MVRIRSFVQSLCVVLVLLGGQQVTAQTAVEAPVESGHGIVLLDGLTASQTVIIDEESYGDPTKLGPLVLSSGLHIVEVGQDAVPIRVVLKAGQTIRLIDQLTPHRKIAASSASFSSLAQALVAPTRETGGLVLAGTGSAAILVGFGFGLSALSVADEASGLDRNTIPRADYDAIVQSAQRRSTAANTSLLIGTAALAGGLYMLYTDGYFSSEGEP